MLSMPFSLSCVEHHEDSPKAAGRQERPNTILPHFGPFVKLSNKGAGHAVYALVSGRGAVASLLSLMTMHVASLSPHV